MTDTIITLMAAWLLLFGAAAWAWREQLDLGKGMLLASLRGLVQLLILAFILDYVFAIQSRWAQALLVLAFCILAARTSASHHPERAHAWLAASVGLACACAVTLPWLAMTGSVVDNTRTLIPLGSMIAANGMNAISLMFNRMNDSCTVGQGLGAAMIPPVDMLRVAGLVHMPGIFVGMVLAGATPLAAASAQLVVLYMIVASSFTACMANPALYTQVMSQNPCTRVRPRRGAQIMVVPLASAATPVWSVCKGSLRASRPTAICCVALSRKGTTLAARARLAYDHRAACCGVTCVQRAGLAS